MIHHLLRTAGREPAFAIGGQPGGWDGAAGGFGQPCFLAEADESDGSLMLYHPSWAVITNTELDHVDLFSDDEALARVYREFVGHAKAGVVLPSGSGLAPAITLSGRDVRTFGFDSDAAVRATDLEALEGGRQRFHLHVRGRSLGAVSLAVSGTHNVANALASLALLDVMGVDLAVALPGLDTFRLPRRRFETVVNARGIQVISDYAHHPTELRALLEQARRLPRRRLLAVFQPHRYSRTKAFAQGFAEALSGLDQLLLVPVYSASEPFVVGGAIEDLARVFDESGHGPYDVCAGLEEAWERLRRDVREGDVVLVIGAGDVDQIGTWAKETWT
jgi:UDP-N-acetylmuramate--alanine ligase